MNPPFSLDWNRNTINTEKVVDTFSVLQNNVSCSAHLLFGTLTFTFFFFPPPSYLYHLPSFKIYGYHLV